MDAMPTTISTERRKELKVTIPASLHLQLLRRKFLHRHTIAETVEEALRAYFDTLDARRELGRWPPH